jgi:hypothetical protein
MSNEMHIWPKQLWTRFRRCASFYLGTRVQETRNKQAIWVKQPVEPLIS